MKKILLCASLLAVFAAGFAGCSQRREWNREERKAMRDALRSYRQMIYLDDLTDSEFVLFSDGVAGELENAYPVYTTFIQMPGVNDTVDMFVVTTIVEELDADAHNMRHIFPYGEEPDCPPSAALPAGPLDRSQQKAFYTCLAGKVNATYSTMEQFFNAVLADTTDLSQMRRLEGQCADELFGGYPYYQECLAFAPYMMVPAPARRALAAAARHLPEGIHGRRFLMRGAHPLPERYIRLEYNFPWAEALDLLAPELGARCAAAPTPWELAAPLFAEIEADEITAMQTADILTWMQQDILLKADKMSMASSLELRVPFLDREVFALASTLPASQRVGRRETKIALRAAAARTLPQATAAMPKQGFVTPLAQWLQEEPWHSQVREVLNGERARRFFRTDRLNALLDEHQRGARSHMKKIWSAYCFLIWHEQYFS